MKANPFLVHLEAQARIVVDRLFEEKAVLIIRLKGTEREEVIKCANIEEAKAVRKEMFATRQDISFALVATEQEHENFLANTR